jgi:hypothetical protein
LETDGIWSLGRADWEALAWQLIERHAILYRVDLGFDVEVAAAPFARTGNVPWRAQWGLLFDDLADTRRCAPRKAHQGFTMSGKEKA